jgi:hypothetical protein
MLGIIDDGRCQSGIVREVKISGRVLSEPIGRLNVAKKSKKAKRGAPARKKKAMNKATPAKKKRNPAPKPAAAPVAATPPLWEGFGGKTEDQ